ncbi:MAG TPA: site-2 protease family protein, partial [Vicinamibacterales bacterium]|nr:site-2 protease family protein [Vicinamibacterales bacterium]
SSRDYPYVAPSSRPPERMWRYITLFVLTLITTTLVGIEHYASFYLGFRTSAELPFSYLELAVRGFWYSLSILAILGAHEFGHYYACRYYGVDASLPYFLPVPPVVLSGTLGAFIRIRQPFPSKRALFDIGIAGPIAGFVVLVPVLMIGMYLSRVIEVPKDFQGVLIELGEPLLFKVAAWLTFGPVPEGSTVSMHPVAFAAWFGMLATTLNLFPVGQTDGGHISYAVLGGRSMFVSIGTVLCLVALSFLSTSWMLWTVLMVAMLVMFGPRHPRSADEHVPLDRTRIWLAVFAVVVFALCFAPVPAEIIDLVKR